MKHITIILALLFTATLFGQNHDVRKNGEKMDINFFGTYLVHKDTSETGLITITLTPTAKLEQELQSKRGSLQGEIDQLNAQSAAIDGRIQEILSAIKEIDGLIAGILKVKAVQTKKVKPKKG